MLRIMNLSITELNSFNYKLIEDDIYVDLNDESGFSTYRMGLLIKIPNNEVSKSLIDKELEDHLIYVEKVLVCEEHNELKYILGGDLEDIRSFKPIIKSKNVFIKLSD